MNFSYKLDKKPKTKQLSSAARRPQYRQQRQTFDYVEAVTIDNAIDELETQESLIDETQEQIDQHRADLRRGWKTSQKKAVAARQWEERVD